MCALSTATVFKYAWILLSPKDTAVPIQMYRPVYYSSVTTVILFLYS